jgi:hypothetical protein
MIIDNSGDIFVTGTSTGTGTGEDYATVRFNGFNGNLIWVSRYNNTETGFNPDEAAYLAISPAGDVIVTGKSYSMNGGWDVLTQKYSGTNGQQQWTKRYNGTANSWDQPFGVICDRFNNIYITAMTYMSGNNFSNTAVIKYSASGNEQWNRFHPENPVTTEYPKALTVDSAGNPYVTIMPNGENYISSVKMNAVSGAVVWQHNYITGGYTEPIDIIVDAGSSIYVSSQTGTRSTTIKYTQLVGVNNNQNNIVREFKLDQNYPNPFNPSTVISFSVLKDSHVKLTIFDAAGRTVSEPVNENRKAGFYKFTFNGYELSAGVYFYKIESHGFTDTKKMILLK